MVSAYASAVYAINEDYLDQRKEISATADNSQYSYRVNWQNWDRYMTATSVSERFTPGYLINGPDPWPPYAIIEEMLPRVYAKLEESNAATKSLLKGAPAWLIAAFFDESVSIGEWMGWEERARKLGQWKNCGCRRCAS